MKKFKYVYVSGPMTNIPKLNFPLFAKVTKELRKAGHLVISPAEMDGKPDINAVWINCMRRDIICMLSKCYAVVLLPNWKKSRGAKIEVWIAKKLSIKIIEYKHWVKGGYYGLLVD